VTKPSTGPRLCDFPPVSFDTWREQVEASLEGGSLEALVASTPEGIDIGPLYAADAPGLPDSVERWARPAQVSQDGVSPPGWEVVAEHAQARPEDLASALAEDGQGGVAGVWLLVDGSLRRGRAAPREGGTGLVASDASALDAALSCLDLGDTPVYLDAGAAALPLAAVLTEVAGARGVEPKALRGGMLCDPLGTLAAGGDLAMSTGVAFASMSALTDWAGRHAPRLATALASGRAHHDAGASGVEELAFVLATAVEYLRAMEAADLEPSKTCPHLMLDFSVADDLFMEIAKLRAARLLWTRILAACGCSDAAGSPRIHAHTSGRAMTPDDPWKDVLRGTIRTFAAVVGGADSVATRPFDDGRLARRMAANTQLLLREESHLQRVVDPGGGSWYVEALTEAVARSAWSLFGEIEKQGGMLAALQAGLVQKRLRSEDVPPPLVADSSRLPTEPLGLVAALVGDGESCMAAVREVARKGATVPGMMAALAAGSTTALKTRLVTEGAP